MNNEMIEKELMRVLAENEQFKEQNAQIREQLNIVTERLDILEKKEKFNRDVLDSNVISIYENMRRKANSNGLLFSAICFCVLIIISEYLLSMKYDIYVIIVTLSFAVVALAAMFVFIVKTGMDAIHDVISFVKEKKNKNK